MSNRMAAAAFLAMAACSASAGTQTATQTAGTETPTAPAEAEGGAPALDDPDAYVHAATGLVFRSRIDPLVREYTREFDDPRLGVGVGYNAEGGHIVSIYVYDLGVDGIPDGAASDLAQQAFEGAESDIYDHAEQVGYANVQRLDSAMLALPEVGLEVRVGHYSFDIPPSDVLPDGGKATSWLLVTACAEHFVKVRYTAPWHALDDARALLDEFLARWSEVNAETFAACASGAAS